MNHKTFVLAGLGSFSLLPALGQTAQSQPNVIFLVADDLGYGDLSCYGATRVETPNVDGLAQHGVCVLLMRMRWHQLVRLRATRCLRANIASVDQELTLLRVMPA